MNAGSGHSDIDSLALAVRDRESRRLINEAITAYRGGAFRHQHSRRYAELQKRLDQSP